MNWNPYRNSTLNDLRAMAIIFVAVLLLVILPIHLLFGRAPNVQDDLPVKVTIVGRLFSSQSEWNHMDSPPSYYLFLPEEDTEENKGNCSYQLVFLTPTKYLAADKWINKQVRITGYVLIDYWGNDADGQPVEASGMFLTNTIEAK